MPSTSRRTRRALTSTRVTGATSAVRLAAASASTAALIGLIGLNGLCLATAAHAAEADATPATTPAAAPATVAAAPAEPLKPAPITRSDMDETLFKQSLAAEVLATRGDFHAASQIYLDGARRLQNQQLFQRAVDMAFRGGLGDQALVATKAWRQALPQSREASQYNFQILLALGRSIELVPAMRNMLQLTPAPSQPQLMLSLPQYMARLPDKAQAARIIDEGTQPWRQPPLEQAEAWFASAESWMLARDGQSAMASLLRGEALKPGHQHVGLVAIDLMGLNEGAEAVVQRQLARADAPFNVRLAYGRKLAAMQRFNEAARYLQMAVDEQPAVVSHRIQLAAVRLELKQLDQAEAALKPIVEAAQPKPATPDQTLAPANATGQAAPRPTPAEPPPETFAEFQQTFLIMAQIAEQRRDLKQANAWLERADPKGEKLPVQVQRARLMAKQGQMPEARALIRALPEAEPRDAVSKAQAETQLLRDAKQWQEAFQVMGDIVKRFPEDSDLLYDQAMLAERLRRFDELERMLRQVMLVAPDNANAYNALGYSLTERGVRLEEARLLIQKALALKPGDPFITDSLGWLAYREGRNDEAARLLGQAYQTRPDPEIAAHLGEVLWQLGQREQAAKVWREGLAAEADNETLQDTLKRFNFKP